jgi:imidazolonepropionase-like amidohydrolase
MLSRTARVLVSVCTSLAVVVAIAVVGHAASAAAPRALTAFVDVNVVSMEAAGVSLHQTVVVADGVITAIGPKIDVPPGATLIDGHGTAWLSPGLVDMHTHAETSDDMKVYLANGVTSVLHMGGASTDFMDQRRPLLNAGQRPGPHVFAAFRVDGSPRYGQFVVTTPDEARWIVRLARTNGYDFMKVYNDLSPACFAALVDEARRQHMAVVGHGITRVGLKAQLDAGQALVAHAEEFFYTTFASQAADADPNAAPDEALIPDAIAFVKRDRAFVTADLATYAAMTRQWGRPAVVQGYLSMPEARYLSADRRLQWRKEDYASRSGSLDARLRFLSHFVKAMSDAGVPLVAGTDAPTIPGLFPGASLHDDLDALVQAGLTPYQALAAATRTPGDFIHATVPGAQPFGTVAVGSRADLILSESNPLLGLSALRRPAGVMVDGHWYDRSQLDALLEGVAADYDSGRP